MKLVINGEQREVEDAKNVLELLQVFKIDHKILVVELNREIIERDSYAQTPLHEGDSIEIVHFVGGG
jgi:sulfur carrier protein